MTPTARSVGDGPPYYRVTLPSGRVAVVRSWRRSRSMDLLAPALSFEADARAIRSQMDAAAERAKALSAGELGAAEVAELEAIAARQTELVRELVTLVEAAAGHLIGAVWADPAWSLDGWDDPTPALPAARGARILGELDDAGWSAADVGALARAARLVLALGGADTTAAELAKLTTRPEVEDAAPVAEATAAESRVLVDAAEIAGNSDAPRA